MRMPELMFSDPVSHGAIMASGKKLLDLPARLKPGIERRLDDTFVSLSSEEEVLVLTAHLGKSALAGFGELTGTTSALKRAYRSGAAMAVSAGQELHRTIVTVVGNGSRELQILSLTGQSTAPQIMIYGNFDDFNDLPYKPASEAFETLGQPTVIASIAEYVLAIAEHAATNP